MFSAYRRAPNELICRGIGRTHFRKTFKWLDAPVDLLGALDLLVVPLSMTLEKGMLPNAEKLTHRFKQLFAF